MRIKLQTPEMCRFQFDSPTTTKTTTKKEKAAGRRAGVGGTKKLKNGDFVVV